MPTTIEKEKLEVLFEGTNSTIYLQEESIFGAPVVVKVSKYEHPTPEQVDIFYNEYDISNSLNIQGVRKVFEKIDYEGYPALVFEYVKGVTLIEAYKQRGRGIKNFLELAIEVTDVLGDIHQCGVIHKDLNVRNILVEEPTNRVKIIDFGIATRFSLKAQDMGNPEKLEGTLAYLSPEQTGRMNRVVDHRSDLYSLGIIFYELLANRLPFEAQDAMELVHAHLAQRPQPLTELDARTPPVLSGIILKLLRKNAEDRYQSATGLRLDLEECLRQWSEEQRILEFPLATRDFSGKLQIPQKLYGREAETQNLLRAFDRICQGPTELWFVSGYSGVGKSALIHELHKPITEKRGYFVEGKFDQFQKSVPYYAWIQAFKSWVNQVLSESPERLRFWRNKILKAVGGNGKVLTDVIPALEHIIGEQPILPELGASEAQNRFNYVFQNFVNIISKKDHPVVIFIDDWQWADTASLELLKIILENYEQDYLLLLGAYRSNEVTDTHPLSLALEEMERENIQINEIKLKNLAQEDVQEILKDALHPSALPIGELATLVFHKTQGNPFFVNQMLKSFYEEDLLTFDWDDTVWRWDMERLNLASITDNVVELLTQKVQKLPVATQDILKLASCIGNRFNVTVLAPLYEELYKNAPRSTLSNLEPALLEGMLIPLRDNYQFAHDRIQQAAYAMLSETERKSVHLQIGKTLANRIPKAQFEEYLFDIVHHWNEGIDFIQEDTEKQFLARLNAEAGKKARISAAYAPAFTYLRTAIKLLPVGIWEQDYSFALEVYCEMMQVCFLYGELEMTQFYVNTVIEKGKTVFDKMPAYEIVMQFHIAQGDNQAAIKAGQNVLDLLDISLTRYPFPNIVVEDLYRLGDIQEPKRKAAMEILDSIITPAWASDPEMFRKITYTMVNISVMYGNSPSACVGYAFYGGLLCGAFNDIELGYKFGKLAVMLLDKYDARFFKSKVENLYLSTVMHWKEPLRDTRKRYFDAIQVGLETGEIEFACYNIVEASLYQFLMGLPLDALATKFSKERSLIVQHKKEFHEDYISAFQQLIAELLSNSPESPTALAGEFFDEQQKLPLFEEEAQLTLSFVSYQAKYILAYLFHDYERAHRFCRKAEDNLEGVTGMAFLPFHAFMSALIMMARFPQVPLNEKPILLERIDENLKKLRHWGKINPSNYQHLADLVQAELYRLSGMSTKAMDFYDMAIDNARTERFLWVEALANELAAEFYFGHGKEKIGKAYLQDAAHRYQLWGAERKLLHLEQRHDKYLKARVTVNNTLTTTSQTIISGNSNSDANNSLDMNTIIKASQTLSGEVKLESLLQKMMHIVIENAGAERGLFVLPDEDDIWVIQAECNAGSEFVECLKAIPIDKVNGNSDTPKLSSEAILYVIRTKETLVLNDASNERSIIGAMYVQKMNPKSILCMPLLYQGKISGILYLENNLTTDAFTPDRLEVLEMLASQITISVENALLYANLEGKVAERTAEVMASKAIIEKKNEDITSSINYAKRIQDASLPRLEKIKKILPQSFLFFKPREIVSGDFYWCAQTEPKPIYDELLEYEQKRQTVIGFEPAKKLITAVDCTGHGVPGAFMSLIGNNLLNEIVISKGITSPEIILQELHKGVRNALQQAETDNKDGMDMALCVIDEQNKTVEFAGAKNPLVYIQNGQLHEVKADKNPIGGVQREKERTFTKHIIHINSPTTFYVFSDGFQDQFGGADGRKFMIKYLKELFLEIYTKPMDEQRNILAHAIEDWMLFHAHEPQRQIDDILVIGFQIG